MPKSRSLQLPCPVPKCTVTKMDCQRDLLRHIGTQHPELLRPYDKAKFDHIHSVDNKKINCPICGIKLSSKSLQRHKKSIQCQPHARNPELLGQLVSRGKPKLYIEDELIKFGHKQALMQLKETLQKVEPLASDLVLDAGCGSGRLTKDYLSKMYKQIDLVDANPCAINEAVNRNSTDGK